jgi:DNA-binding NarL/FixJ family response regulator
MSAQAPLRILIADDHDLMRQGAGALIGRQPGWEVCGVAATGREAVDKASLLKPDIVIMDMTMPELNGVDAAVQIRRRLPDTEIVMLTAHEDEDLIRDAFAAGVKSFIFKSQTYDFLVAAIESLSQHKPFFTPEVSEILFSNMLGGESRQGSDGAGLLTSREREVVQLLAEGKANKEVAAALGISVRTVEAHRANILAKLKLDSLAALIRYAIRKKLVEP